MRTVTADRGTLDDATHQLNLSGNVHIEEGEQTVDAEKIDYNTASENVNAKGNVTIKAPAQSQTTGVQSAATRPPGAHSPGH
jgi:lipopolysaccharide assembly outer membrane protein LptD (OstA)